MSSKENSLRTELKAAGASSSELSALVGIAGSLRDLKTKDLPRAPHPRLGRALSIGLPAAMSLALGMFLVIASQAVLPGSPLYPLQEASDNITVSIDSSYRGTLMMKRADQVKELVDKGSPEDTVLSALADYTKQASSYKSSNSNYAAFEYCKSSLSEAAERASAGERQAINKTLSTLDDV